VSEQNPSAAQVPEVPSAPVQPGPGAQAQESMGPAPTPVESMGSAAGPRETLGSAPTPPAQPAPTPPGVAGSGENPPPADPPAPPAAETSSAGPSPAETSAPTPAAPRRKSNLVLWIVGLLVVVLVLIGGYWFFAVRNNPRSADVGDCLSGTEDTSRADEIKLVDCGDPGATFKVTKKIDDQPKDNHETVCEGVEHDDVYWSSANGNTGTVLCLRKLNG
jgi:hypothetical protein